MATKRKKAADALAAAGRSKSPATIRRKTNEAERATKDANDAEKKRAHLEKTLADTDVKVTKALFFAKQWTQAELDALFGKKMDSGEDLVLPIGHHVSKDEVQRRSPLLAGVLALNTAVSTVDEIADAWVEVVQAQP